MAAKTRKKSGAILIPFLVLCCLVGMLLSRDLLRPSASSSDDNTTSDDEEATNALRKELRAANIDLEKSQQEKKDIELKLAAATENVQDLQQKLEKCNQERQQFSFLERMAEQKEDKKQANEENIKQTSTEKQSPVCKSLSQLATNSSAIPTASFVWNKLLGEIHQATNMLPNDPKFVFHDFTAQLLQMISSQLPRTVQTLPRTWESVDAILDVGWKRYQYLKDHPELRSEEDGIPDNINQKDIPRPIKIVIMGGSLLQGTNCRKMIRDLNMQQVFLSLRECAWGNRLKKFINHFFQLPLVQVTNIGVGGTNSETGTVLLHNELLPPEASSPDIIINAYGTNDMHVWTMEQANQSNATLGSQVRTMVQEFVRNATLLRHQKICRDEDEQGKMIVPPLVLRFEDYLGNEQRQIVDTMEGALNVHMLAQYYGFGSMSYAELARGFVYADTHERWLSPIWYEPNKPNEMIREIHPLLSMHMAAAWVAAYNFLNIVSVYCSIEPWKRVSIDSTKNEGSSFEDDILQIPYETSRTYLPQLPELRGDTHFIPEGKPRPLPKGLLPRLTPELSLDHISDTWKNEATELQKLENQQSICSKDGEDTLGELKCPFAWVSRIRVVPLPGVEETKKGSDKDAGVAYWKAHAVDADFNSRTSGWKWSTDHNKIGIVPKSKVGAELTLQVPHQPLPSSASPLRTVTIFYMKSYGLKWDGSTIKVEVLEPIEGASKGPDSASWTVLQSLDLNGFHAKNTSETYTETIHLKDRQATSLRQLRIRLSVIAGSTFKITGLLACR